MSIKAGTTTQLLHPKKGKDDLRRRFGEKKMEPRKDQERTIKANRFSLHASAEELKLANATPKERKEKEGGGEGEEQKKKMSGRTKTSVASFPAMFTIGPTPPGCLSIKLVISYTRSSSTTQQSSLVLCVATLDLNVGV